MIWCDRVGGNEVDKKNHPSGLNDLKDDLNLRGRVGRAALVLGMYCY